ncbi:molybdopterin synthase catalytic subunit MoaE [Aestuariibacter sp. AA17]|uniref:Molybdopterin synthase catalytic subunit n=1 Tax=Fluctibacter corallii TaxID=2984329 RepID=A0ABT3A5R0_9ALTE|nr:molybdopterin synthase catalytic subunit MoaE [Aestuariibacter sp. AA17]MCV2884022.1 molybdopterin synthase catalytic subunit MoaE [Aestuariibacter sp. AA17]
MVSVQSTPIDVNAAYSSLTENTDADGAAVFFVGKVRDNNVDATVYQLTLEHYPGMTERVIEEIISAARARWSLNRISVIHRVGPIQVGEEIVFVGVTSTHRHNAFNAAEFIMDKLKTQAPFWKKERSEQGEKWIEARESDTLAADKWS